MSPRWLSIRQFAASPALALAVVCAGFGFNLSPARAQTPTPNAEQYGLVLIGAEAAWQLGYTGAAVTVAVGDTGIDEMHLAFAGKIDLRSKNFQQGCAQVVQTSGGKECESYRPYFPKIIGPLGDHGTHVAGIIAAAGNSDAPGVAYNADLVVLRAIGALGQVAGFDGTPQKYSDPTAASLRYFAGLQNVMVYNASYGPVLSPEDEANRKLPSWPSYTIFPTDAAAALAALQKGKIIVAATGNERGDNPIAGLNPAGLALDPFIQPSNANANANANAYQDGGNNYNFSAMQNQPGLVIGVTSINKDKRISNFANQCGVTASWCIAAPGENVYSTLPKSSYGFMSGTSMATPMVSGALAVLERAYPGYNAQDLAHVIFATAENIGGEAADNGVYGYGLLRLDRAVAGPTTLAAGSNIAVAAQNMTYWSQPLTTGGGFNVDGPGYLNIAGRTTATGNVMVSGGALAVDGTLTLGNSANLSVSQGAWLTGFGTINGPVFVNGTLNAGQLPNYADLIANNHGKLPANIPLAGTSPGTLTFQSDVTLGTSARTRVNVDGQLAIPGGPGTYDKIIISGGGSTFKANGTLAPILRGIPGGNNNYTPADGSLFPFLTATKGASVAGQFLLSQPSSGLAPNTRFDLLYSTSSMTLTVDPASFAMEASSDELNESARSFAKELDVIRPAAGERIANPIEALLFNALGQENVAGDDAALTALSGPGLAAMPSVVMNTFNALGDAVAVRQELAALGGVAAQSGLSPNIVFAYAGGGGLSVNAAPGEIVADASSRPAAPWLPAQGSGFNTWGEAVGNWSSVGSRNGNPGFSANLGGFVIGADRDLGNLLAGGAFGYARAAAAASALTGTSSTYAGSGYVT